MFPCHGEARATSPPRLVTEQKWVGHRADSTAALALLDARCLPDPEHPAGRISSVYFDSPDGRAYEEKANGDNLKVKVRIRWYDGDARLSAREIPIFIEVKQRIGQARRKCRVCARAPGQELRAAPMDGPFFSELLTRHAGQLDEPVPAGLVPMLRISYERWRYVCPETGGRVAVDRDIAGDRFNPLYFNAPAPVRLDSSVCEYKSNGARVPSWAGTLAGFGYRLQTFSKFGACVAAARSGGTPA